MPDVSAVITLTPPSGPAVVFNNGSLKSFDDLYWLSDIQGMDTAEIRNPKFKRPQTSGFRLLPFLENGLEPRFEGAFIIQSTRVMESIREKRNQMYAALKTCLRACLPSPGSLDWTEAGVGAMSLDVQYEIRLEHGWNDDYSLMTFKFGLTSEASQP